MILDIITVAVIILFIVIGSIRGAAKALFGAALSFFSYIAASWLARFFAAGIYGKLIEPVVFDSVSSSVEKLISGSVKEASQALPWWLEGALGLSGGSIVESAAKFTSDVPDNAARAVNSAVEPIITGMICIVLTVLFFVLLTCLGRALLKKPLLSIFELPVISTLNRFAGGALGAVEGVIVVMMLAYLLRLLLPHFGNEVWYIDESTIYNSFIFYHFYSGNIFTALSSWILTKS